MANVFDVIWLVGDESFLSWDDWDVDDTVVDTCVTFVTIVVVVVVCDVTTGGDFRFFSGSGLGSFWAWDGFTDSGTFIELIISRSAPVWSGHLVRRPVSSRP